MLSPFLLIGIGGSGGKTLRTARADLERQLANLGWSEPFPDAWQFLHIDVPTKPDGMDAGMPGALPTGCYSGLIASGVNYKTVDKLLTQSLKSDLNLDATAGWRPHPTQVSVPIDRGAGQYRAIGRMITVTHLGAIKSAIEKAVGRLQQPEIKGQLMRFAELVGADTKQDMRDPVFLIVSSIAGGSGAGAVVDVSWALRAAGVEVEDTGMILYAPDVFDGIPENMRKGVRPNALATLSELCAAWWDEDGISETAHAVYNAEGLVIPQSEGRVPGMILVGRKNSANLDYVEQNAVYTAMGRALSAWMTSEVLQDQLTAYVTGNGAQASYTTVGEFPAGMDHQPGPFRAIGYARVSLGRNLFREYTTEYLARAGVETALRKHHDQKRGSDDERSERELVKEAVELNFGGLAVEAGLNERGTDCNDVLDALAPALRDTLFTQLKADISAQFIDGIGAGKDANSIRRYISSAAESFAPGYIAAEKSGQTEKAKLWVNDIQSRIVAAVAASVSRSGISVATEMVNRLVKEEVPHLVGELSGEARDYLNWGTDLDSAVNAALLPAANANIQANNPLIAEAVNQAALALFYRSEASLRQLAVDLLDDLGQNFLLPLALALESARQRLVQDEAPTGAVPSEISLWPMADDVPTRLRPSPNEFLLEDPETYPKTRKKLVERSVNLTGGNAEAEVVGQILCGAPTVGAREQRMIEVDLNWVPARAELREGSKSSQRAQFSVALRGDDILRRANEWAIDGSTPMGRFLGESLTDYLSAESTEPEVRASRVRQFEGQFSAAVGAAAPLAAVDNKMLTQVHNQKDVPTAYVISTIPFPAPSEAREAAIRVLSHAGLDPAKYEFADSRSGNIDIFTAVTSTLQPVVFESLMRPIASEWAAVKLNPQARASFWRWRRARPLPEFVPLAPALRRAMVRGWFTASLLQRLTQTPAGAWSIYDPEAKEAVGFPFPLLQPDVSLPYDNLPAVLKSIPLAWLDCSAQGDLMPMRAYRVLRDLGGSGVASDVGDYTVNRTLQRWLASGDPGDGGPTVPEGGATAQDRVTYAMAKVDHWQKAYREVFHEAAEQANPLAAPRAYELRDDIVDAFNSLRLAIQNAMAMEAAASDFN